MAQSIKKIIHWNWTDLGKWVSEVSLFVEGLSRLCAVIGKGKKGDKTVEFVMLFLLPPLWFDLICFLCDFLNVICLTDYWLLFYWFDLIGLLMIVLIVICKFVLFVQWLDYNLCLSSFLIFCNWWWTIVWLDHNSCKFTCNS